MDAAGGDLDPRAEPHGLVGVPVGVDGALRLVRPVRKRGELGARPALGVVDELVHRREDGVAPVPGDERLDAPDARRVGRDLRAEVARRLVLRADLREEEPEDVVDDRAAADDADRAGR